MKKALCGWVFLFSLAGSLLGGPGAMGAEVELGQVVVTATRTEIEIGDVPQSVSVITKEEIMNSLKVGEHSSTFGDKQAATPT